MVPITRSWTLWGVHWSLQCMQVIFLLVPPLCYCLPLSRQKSMVSCANAKTQSHSKCSASIPKKNPKISCKHTNGKQASLSQHKSTWWFFMFDWPHPTKAKARQICRATTNNTAAQRRHSSRLIGQASSHQSQSQQSQRHHPKESVWVTHELLGGRSFVNGWPLTNEQWVNCTQFKDVTNLIWGN